TVDESFSSARAYALLKDMRARGPRRKIRKTDIDKAAAAIILQSWFACHDGLPAERGTS
ncbi:MAG: Holliday junction resolvase RuvX, partial [Proteobacteria bacterium]|nr:Holliday junction resolvase RuvX [Pseudomonadota bacterium]